MTATVPYHQNGEALHRWKTASEDDVTKPAAMERCKIAYWADKLGYVPIIGTAVGIARIVCSVVVGVFSTLAAISMSLVCCSDLAGKCIYVTGRSLDEFIRGFIELIPGCSYYSDRTKEKWEKEEGRLTEFRGAYGRYVYQSPPDHEWVVYSQEKYAGQILWKSRKVGDEVRGVNGYKNPN